MDNEKKKGKKWIVIAVIVLVIVVVAGGVGGYFAYQYVEDNKTVGTDWGDTYYSILSTTAEANQGDSNYASLIETEAEDTTVQFIEVEEDEIPYMVVSYTKDDVEKVMISKLNDPETTATSVSVRYDGASVEYLYNISLEQNIWYLHLESSTIDTYKPLYTEMEEIEEDYIESGYIEGVVEDEETQDVGETYTISKDSVTSVETVDGETLSISEFEQTFIEIEVDESTKVDIDFDNMSSKEIKAVVTEAVTEYKTNDEIITEEVEETISSKVEEVNTKLAEIEEAKEAVAEAEAKAAEEEAARLAAEEAAKGLKVGSFTLKYGIYKGEAAATGETLTINSDGTATLKSSSNTYQLTYTIGRKDFSQDSSYGSSYEDAIIFSNGLALYPVSSSSLSDGGTSDYTYSGS